jgi:SAM-dependent methyltransferase
MAQIERALRHSVQPPQRILDLPCGHGRVTRHLRARFPSAHITVCDISRPGVDFCVNAFGAEGIYSPGDLSKLDLGAPFDLIWIGSLITHFNEKQTRELFDLAAHHLSPDGSLVISAHGKFVAERMMRLDYGLTEPAVRGLLADWRMTGYGFRAYPGGDSYGISVAHPAWFRNLFNRGPLRLVDHMAQAWDNHQDVLILRRRDGVAAPSSFMDRLRRLFSPNRPHELYAAEAPPPPNPQRQEEIDQTSVTGFDADFYLARHPDVAAAVASGIQPSGLAHYMGWGWKEGREPCDPASTFEQSQQQDRADKVGEVWSVDAESQAQTQGWYWMAHPAVRDRLNRLASGNSEKDAYAHLETILNQTGLQTPIPRSLSLGCGFGGLERDLTARGIVGAIDAYDIAPGAIAQARILAEAEGMDNIRYHLADLETEDLPPGQVDCVFAHQSVHHVERLEAVFQRVSDLLSPRGLFHLHEFVGPTRFQWTDAQLSLINGFLESLPDDLRRLPSGALKPAERRPTIEEMIKADPSEAIRSADIRAVLADHFEIIDEKRLGGTLAHLALGGIAQNFDPENAEHNAWLQSLFDLEDDQMRAGIIDSDFVVLIARKR